MENIPEKQAIPVPSQVGKVLWRREWLSIPVFLPGVFHGQRSLVGYSPWGHKELDTTEVTEHTHLYYISSWRQVAAIASSPNHKFFARLSIEVTFHSSLQVFTFMLLLPSGEGVSFLIP